MARVYTVTPGAVINVGTFGVATNDTPAVVPADVAGELAASDVFRVEAEEGEDIPEPADDDNGDEDEAEPQEGATGPPRRARGRPRKRTGARRK